MKNAVLPLVGIVLIALSAQVALGSDSAVIAFDGRGEAKGPVGIWVMDEDGGNKTLVYEACPISNSGYVRPHWSPEGDSLVFVGAPSPWALYRVEVNRPEVCPEAELIAESNGVFYLNQDSAIYLWDLGLDNLDYSDLLEEAHWSPGRNEIAVRLHLEIEDVGVIAVADLDSGRLKFELLPIYAAPGKYIHDLAWAPTGTQLAVVQSPSDDWDAKQLLIVDRQEGTITDGPWTPQQIGIPSTNALVFPDWARSTGSRRIASQAYFDPNGGNKPKWWIVIVDFAEPVPLMELVVPGWSPSWSPDDQHLVFGSPKGNLLTKVVKRVELATGIVTTLGGQYSGGGSPSTDWSRAVPTNNYCGDGSCDWGEECTCAIDCGDPWPNELQSVGECSDEIDNDCDGLTDCDDRLDCDTDPTCVLPECSALGDKKTCNAEATCRWDNRKKVCLDN